MNTIQSAWEKFERASVPAAAGIVERRRQQRAFYLGAYAILELMAALEKQGISDEGAAHVLTGLDAECEEFAVKGLCSHG